jgi:hypothetical protein
MTLQAFDATLEVTQDDIEEGVQEDCEACPVARALYRIAQRFSPRFDAAATAYLGTLYLEVDGDCWEADTPDKVCRFIQDFDAGKPVHPFTCPLTFRP